MNQPNPDEPFLEAPIDRHALERAVVHFHRVVRPLLERQFPRVSWLELADLASEVELRLMQRLAREIDRLGAQQAFESGVPHYGSLVWKWLDCDRQPKLKQRRALAAKIQTPCFYRLVHPNVNTAEHAPLDTAGATSAANLYLQHTDVGPSAAEEAPPTRLVKTCRDAGIFTIEHARLAISRELTVNRSPTKPPKPLGFDSEKAWISFCLQVARTVRIDMMRKHRSSRLTYGEIEDF